MGSDEPVEQLSELLTSLQDLNCDEVPVPKQALNHRVESLLAVQEQMMLQLRLHDAQIAALREVIALLSDKTA